MSIGVASELDFLVRIDFSKSNDEKKFDKIRICNTSHHGLVYRRDYRTGQTKDEY